MKHISCPYFYPLPWFCGPSQIATPKILMWDKPFLTCPRHLCLSHNQSVRVSYYRVMRMRLIFPVLERLALALHRSGQSSHSCSKTAKRHRIDNKQSSHSCCRTAKRQLSNWKLWKLSSWRINSYLKFCTKKAHGPFWNQACLKMLIQIK